MLSFLIRHFIPENANIGDPSVRSAYGMPCGAVAVVLNVLLFLIKVAAGIMSGSISIMTDAFNNLTDAGSSIVTLIGFRMADKRPDPEHPFGHGRIEYIAGMSVSLFIIIMAVELIRTSFDRILHPVRIETGTAVCIILICSILIKLYMFYYQRRIAGKIGSSALQASATDSVSDAADTLIVLVCALVSRHTGLHLDGPAGMAVGFLILRSGIAAMKETVSPLLGQPPESSFVRSVEEIVMSHPMILGMHDLIVHNYGPGRVFISLDAEVSAEENIIDAHDMIDHVERELKEKLKCEATIHLDPLQLRDTEAAGLKLTVDSLIKDHPEIQGIHDFRLIREGLKKRLLFDVLIPDGYDRNTETITSSLKDEICSKIGSEYEVEITVDFTEVL